MAATFTGTLWPDSTTQQWASSIETTLRISDHPTMAPALGVFWLPLRFDNQGNGRDLIATITECITVPSLQNQIGAIPKLEPTTRLWEVIHFKPVQKDVALGLSELNQHDLPHLVYESTFPN